MATVFSDHPSSSSNGHIISVKHGNEKLPFPTTPSVPDRRARLKRLNMSVANREREFVGDYKNSRISTDFQLESSTFSDSISTSGSFPGGYSGRLPVPILHNLGPTRGDARELDSARRRKRNIVKSRLHEKRVTLLVDRTSPNDTFVKDDDIELGERLKLPNIGVNQRTVSPTERAGVFLTALADLDGDTPVTTERNTTKNEATTKKAYHSSSSPSPGVSPTKKTKETSSPSSSTAGSTVMTRDLLPSVVTLREGDTSRVALTSRSTVGLQRVYLEGLDYMRSHVGSIEEAVHAINRDFHRVQEEMVTDYHLYLKECDLRLLQANSDLHKQDVKLQVVDSEAKLVRILTELRQCKSVDRELIAFLTKFWNELKGNADKLQTQLDKFNQAVLQRLSNNYISSHNADIQIPVCQQYALDIEGFLKDLDTQLTNTKILLKSYGNRLQVELFDKSDFSAKLLQECDVKAFPVLGFIHDVCGKILKLCECSRMWLARDEQFMHEINTFIKEIRGTTRRREMVLQTEKQKHKRHEKNLKIANTILAKNKEKLQLIEVELDLLEKQMTDSVEERKHKAEEIHQKETMVDFLKLTLTQTKKNYSLQTKRTKLLRQVKDLEDYVRLVEKDLEEVQDQILAKSHERILLTEKINTSKKSYDALKHDFQHLSDDLEKLEADVSGLSSQLLQLEIINTIRTSPETLDNLIDRPSTVKLSQSLKERIRERKKKASTAAGKTSS